MLPISTKIWRPTKIKYIIPMLYVKRYSSKEMTSVFFINYGGELKMEMHFRFVSWFIDYTFKYLT